MVAPGRRRMGVWSLRFALAMLVVSHLNGWVIATDDGSTPIPTIESPVTDLTTSLSGEETERLSKALSLLRADHGVHMAVLVVATTGGLPISDYAFNVANKWGGSDTRDQGVLLVLAIGDRRSRLEVGYGLEAVLGDARAREILDGMRSYLRGGRLDDAVRFAIDEVGQSASGKTELSQDDEVYQYPASHYETDQTRGFIYLLLLILGPVLLVVLILALRNRRSGGWNSGWEDTYTVDMDTINDGGWPGRSGSHSSWGSSSDDSVSSYHDDVMSTSNWGSSSDSSSIFDSSSALDSSFDSSSSSSSDYSSHDWSGGDGGFGGGGASSGW